MLASEPENCATPSRMPASRPTSRTPSRRSELRSTVLRSGEPTNCIDGSLRARAKVADLVVPLVEQPRRVHPPQDVLAPIGPRQSDVLPDGEGDRAPGTVQLLGDLDPARRSADDEDTTVGQLARVAVVRRGERSDPGGQAVVQRGHVGNGAGARGEHDRPCVHARCPDRSAPRTRARPAGPIPRVVLARTGAALSFA